MGGINLQINIASNSSNVPDHKVLKWNKNQNNTVMAYARSDSDFVIARPKGVKAARPKGGLFR